MYALSAIVLLLHQSTDDACLVIWIKDHTWGFESNNNNRFRHNDSAPEEVSYVRCIKD